MKEQILLNGRFVTQPMTGVQRVAYELGRRLIGSRDDVRAVAPTAPEKPYSLQVHQLQNYPVELRGHVWEQLVLGRAASKARLTISLGNTGPIVTKGRQLIMIHDVNYLDGPEAYSGRFRRAYRMLNAWHAKHSHICTVSNYSANRLAHHFHIARERISIIPNAAEHILGVEPDLSIIQREKLNGRLFFLAVGSANHNKNIAGLIKAYSRLNARDVQLVVVGGRADHIFQDGQTFDCEGVKYLGYVNDGELRSLYETALAFIFPSFLEGFGVPALEAMLLGCPVAASNSSALPEVCGDSAIYFGPNNTSEIADALQRLLNDQPLRKALAVSGRAHAASYSWDRSARSLGNLVNNLL